MTAEADSKSEERAAGSRRLPYGHGRQALIEATVRLVARDGLSRFTYRSVTAEAGVTQGSLRHHFPHLVGLLEAALEWCVELSQTYSTDLMGDLQNLIAHFEQLLEEHPELPSFLAEVFVASRHEPELSEVVRRYQEIYRERVRVAVEAAGIPSDDELIDVILAMADGLLYQRVVFGDSHAGATERQVAGSKRVLGLVAAAYASPKPADL